MAHANTQYNMKYIWSISLIAALGGLLFGYDWVVIGGAKPFFERFFHLTGASQKGWANSCALIGCLLGALVSGALSDKTGRKRLLIFSAFLFAVSSIGTGLANTFIIFVVWRMIGGIAIGLASNLSPMYIAEVAPAEIRGRLVSINQLTIVIGILLAQIINWSIAEQIPEQATDQMILATWTGQTGWRWMFAITAIPSMLFFIGMFFVPESPRWLAKNGKDEQARRILTKIGGKDFADQAINEIDATLVNEVEKVNFKDLLEPKMTKILLLGIVLAVYQQWCGINVIFNYAEEIFAEAGYGVSQILFNIVITGAVNLLFTFVAIGTVDHWGRKKLMLSGSAGLALTYILIGSCYFFHIKGLLVLILVLTAIACYGCSLAPITWVILSEIFPNRIRGAAMSVAVFSLWVGCFILTYTFPFLKNNLGPAFTFWLYSIICICGFVFIAFQLPETKGKTLEEIERELVD